MCFSAQASFLAGTGLSLFGIHILRSAYQRKQRYFLAIPLMFGIQQLSEGVVWLSKTNSSYAVHNNIATALFLFFAFFVWPIWIPFSLGKIETDKRRRRLIFGFFMTGLALSTTIAWITLNLGVTTNISCNHIKYIVQWPEVFVLPGTIWYLIITITPFFLIKKRIFHFFGTLLFFGVVITGVFYYAWFTSVWCFFAAILSFLIYKMK